MCVLVLARGEVYTGPGCFPSIPPGRCRQPEGRHVEARGGFLQDQLVWYPRTFTPDPCSLSCCARPCYQVLMRASEAVGTRKGGGGGVTRTIVESPAALNVARDLRATTYTFLSPARRALHHG